MTTNVPIRLRLLGTFGHRLAGTLTVDDSPARRLVIALRRPSMRVQGSARSDATTGEWEIDRLPKADYTVIALDNQREFEPVAADYIEAVPMAFD